MGTKPFSQIFLKKLLIFFKKGLTNRTKSSIISKYEKSVPLRR